MRSVRALPTTPPDVAAFLSKSRIPRARATKKLKDVLHRVAAGESPLDRVREIWVFGSYARGAADVGDVDLLMLVDEPRSEQQFSLDTFYGRRRPYADQIAATGCSGSSFVSVQASPVFGPVGEPASPERLATRGGTADTDLVPVTEPVLHHVATGQPLAGPFLLLWARGDELAWAFDRLHAIVETPDAGRHDRTTTVPLLDDLALRIDLETSFALARHIRRGTLTARTYLLRSEDPPAAARRALELRYGRPNAKPSVRQLAGAAALHYLEEEGTDLRDVHFVGGPVTSQPRSPTVFVDFNPFQLYRAAPGSFDAGDRVVNVWPSGRQGPWLALEIEVLDHDGVLDLYHWLTALDQGAQTRFDRLLEVLDESVDGE